MQKHVISFTHRKALASTSSYKLKYLLENDTAPEGILVIGRTETMFKLYFKEALLMHRHKPTLNIQKEA